MITWSEPEAVRIARLDVSDFELSPPMSGLPRWPSLAIDDTRTVHLIWETQTSAGGISYSSAPTATFSPPSLLISNSKNSGSLRASTVIAHGAYLIITWIDSTGGHVARFDIADLP